MKDGFDMGQVITGQRKALSISNGQPTAVVYRTEKGFGYGITGKKSHGGGHKRGSEAYIDTLRPLLGNYAEEIPHVDDPGDAERLEACHWATLEMLRDWIRSEANDVCQETARRLEAAKDGLDQRQRSPRAGAPDIEELYRVTDPVTTPTDVALDIGSKIALRSQLGRVLGYLNEKSGGSILLGAADLLDSTAISGASRNFSPGFFHYGDNPDSRTLTMGGICEDGLSCILSGISGFGKHCGAGASYGAFISPLGHIPARVHAISQQMKQEVQRSRYAPFILQCGHAGMKTGEDGPTHADPQALQLHIENYAPGTAVTLTPWEPQEIWPLVAASFQAQAAVIVPFVTRPGEPVLDREALGLAPASEAAKGVYKLRSAASTAVGTIVLQGSGVALAFVQEALPRLTQDGIDLDVIYVASPELFDQLPQEERDTLFNDEIAATTMGITGFTLPTMYRWIRSDIGLKHSLHPFVKGHYLGSGAGEMVIHEAGLDGEAQARAIMAWLDDGGGN
ncbi:MAG TPA: hypothetical protein DCS75_05920 [Gemmatimonadetes bacterium]|nr:hypothetical protein [Gemmatimonadota bacterium]